MSARKKQRAVWVIIIILCFLLLCIFTHFMLQAESKAKHLITNEVEITVKDYGTITVSLCGENAPEAVERFISLTESGSYDNLTFYRIIDGFMLQAGHVNESNLSENDKSVTGNDGSKVQLSHTRGAVSIPYLTDDDSEMEFFIVQKDSTYLDGAYQVVGYVSEGMDIVDRICSDAKPIDDNGRISDSEQPVILSVTLCE